MDFGVERDLKIQQHDIHPPPPMQNLDLFIGSGAVPLWLAEHFPESQVNVVELEAGLGEMVDLV